MNNRSVIANLFSSAKGLACIAIVAGGFLSFGESSARAEIPVERFLERLKEQRLQGLAVDYLEYLRAHGFLKSPYVDDFELTKLDLLQSDAANIASSDKREARYKAVEDGYKSFLQSQPNHPRRGEARGKLAEMYLEQGQRFTANINQTASEADKEKLREQSRAVFQEAEKLFNDSVNELAEELKKILGAKIDPTDTAATAARESMQNDYRKSQILIGIARKMIAETYAEGTPQRSDWLAKSETQFNDIISKVSHNKEAGTYLMSLLYCGQVQAAQKKTPEAIANLMRVTELADGPAYRKMKVQATSSLMRLLGAPPENKFEAAIQKGAALLAEQQTSEKDVPEWQELQMAVLETRDAWIASMKDDPKKDNSVKAETKDLRSDLQKLSRLQSPVGAKARELLVNYGVDVAQPEAKVPKVRNFEEAFKEATDRFMQWEQEGMNIKILQTQLENNPSNPDQIKTQISNLESGQSTLHDQASQLYQRSLQLFNPAKDNREELTVARLRFAFLHYIAQKYDDAAAVGDLTARTNRGSPDGLKAAEIAIYSYQKVIEGAQDPAAKPMQMFNSLSDFIVKNWPDSDLGTKAASVVLSSAVNENRLDEALTVVANIQSPEKQAQMQRDVGYVFYGKYLEAVVNATKAEQATDAAEIVKIRDQAEDLLQQGLASLTAENLDVRGVEAGWALASIQLNKGQVDKALETLNRPQVGPVAVINAGSQPISSKARMDILRLVLQAEVSQASSTGQALNASRVESIVGEMQKLAAESPDNAKLLTNALIVLANELRGQIAQQKSDEGKKKIASSLEVLLGRLIDASEDPTMLEWASMTLSEIAKSIKDQSALKSTADELSNTVEKGFTKLIGIARENPAFLEKSKQKIEDIQYRLAKALTAAGKYEQASKEYLAVLKINGSSLQPQVDAAMNYQLWANGTNGDLLIKAMMGAEPDPTKNGKNIVWGWAQLAKSLAPAAARDKSLAPYFLEARYQLASCQFSRAQAEKAPNAKTKAIEVAFSIIKQTYVNDPTLGKDAAIYKKYDDLVRSIQTALKQEVVGLQALAQ
jgi:hypothetical protein